MSVRSGLARYGHTEAALTVLNGIYDGSMQFAQHRLPELFCGFPRRPGEGPTLYPVACSPQAWAAAAVTAMLATCLGLTIDALAKEVSFRTPRLPHFIDRIELRELRVGAGAVDLRLQRYARSVGVEVTRNVGDIAVRIEV